MSSLNSNQKTKNEIRIFESDINCFQLEWTEIKSNNCVTSAFSLAFFSRTPHKLASTLTFLNIENELNFFSASNPRPALILVLYRRVGQCTTGLTGPETGLGARRAAFCNLAFRRLSFLAVQTFATICGNGYLGLCCFLCPFSESCDWKRDDSTAV
ncbi:hypothetical protein BpHYR1_021779 [Brachionus plicatilis]|uniref:Uncharacterized protein n=1 Tax=Brachionus plicatilis TaxID=10195 RepID=A0A3M7P8J9_BRAPC|nr:hypothetical protein BpHYR1_021779 [Brachionus plicatilis]